MRDGGSSEENRASVWGRGGLNVRSRLTSARPRSPRPSTSSDPQHPNSRRGAGSSRARARALRSAAGGRRLPQGRGKMGKPASGFTCDAQGPAVELHCVVERRGHHVQDAARLRIQESHRGREREPAAAAGENEDPRGRADLEGDGRGSERQLGPLQRRRPGGVCSSSSSERRGGGDAVAAAAAASPAREQVPSRLPGGGGGVPALSAEHCSALPPRAAAAPISSAAVTWARAGRRGPSSRPRAGAPAPGCCGRGRAGARCRCPLPQTPFLATFSHEYPCAPSPPPSPASGPQEEYTAFPRVTSHPPLIRLRKHDRKQWAVCG